MYDPTSRAAGDAIDNDAHSSVEGSKPQSLKKRLWENARIVLRPQS